jgi:serine/threonine protein kinase/formylglycine-generating enzyme required for sulfatase activity
MKIGDVIDKKYRLVRRLGSGGMGEVFEVLHEVIHRRFALKCLRPHLSANREAGLRFVQEAQAAAVIGSRHIIDVTDGGISEEGAPYIVMEYLEGEELEVLIQREAPLSPEHAAAILLQVCAALGAAHDKKIVHRDIKPANIFVTSIDGKDEWIKVLDFGIAKVHAEDRGGQRPLTQANMCMGTPPYMAPEQLQSAEEADPRADVYACGVCLYEMLSGHLPYEVASIEALLYEMVAKYPIPIRHHLPAIDDELEAVVMTAMARERAERYQTMEALAAALAPFAERQDAIPSIRQHLAQVETDYRKAFEYQTIEPRYSLTLVRLVSEAICKQIFEERYWDEKKPLHKYDLVEVINVLNRHKVFPRLVRLSLNTTQEFGNLGPHDHGEEGERLTAEFIQTPLAALRTLVRWYFEEYREKKPPRALLTLPPDHRGVEPEATAPVPKGFVKIRPGTFMMGSTEVGTPQREATIPRPFLLQTTPVMQDSWRRLMGNNPSEFRGGDLPVERVSWFDAVAYCNALSRAEGLECAYVVSDERRRPGRRGYTAQVRWRGLSCPGYRLPTEAEWEYACRAGTAEPRYDDLVETVWFSGNSGGMTHAVGQRQANAWGLHDTLGNVWEWCHDLVEQEELEGDVPAVSGMRVAHGGSWSHGAEQARASSRLVLVPQHRAANVGFRVARSHGW